MTRLGVLRGRLQALRGARRTVRWGRAAALLGTAVLTALLAAYGLDYTLRLNVWLRAAVLVGLATAGGWFLQRFVWPGLSRRESLEEVALTVEREHAIDSDLVAALQFDAAGTAAWGSPRLSTAVIDYVAEFSQTLDVFRGFTWDDLPRRLAVFGAVLVIAGGVYAFAPEEAGVFWRRFWLGGARYPTATRIVGLTINGVELSPLRDEIVRLPIPEGTELIVDVTLEGRPTQQVTAELRGLDSGERGAWTLTSSGDQRFAYRTTQLTESTRLVLRAGDAVSDPIDLALVPLPVVDVVWTVTPPAYAVGGRVPAASPGSRQLTALQGSALDLRVSGINKRLKRVALKLPDVTIPLEAVATSFDREWRLPETHPLQELRAGLRYELEILDTDGLRPEPAVAGELRLQGDRHPQVAAAVVSRRVLPTAGPKISYGATDDFGLAELRWLIEIVKADGTRATDSRQVWTGSDSDRPTKYRGTATLDLTPYRLEKGDEVRVTVVAEDHRGPYPAGLGQGEPLVFDVTDRNGILEGLLEIDQQSAKQLDEIIERELGIGRTSR